MLSVGEMRKRSAMLDAMRRGAGGDVTDVCRIRMDRMPLVTAGEDAVQHIPFALHPDVAPLPAQPVRSLRDLSVRYMVEGVVVSAHKLPQPDAQLRRLMQALRKSNPLLPAHLVHHWCADAQGGVALRQLLLDNWKKAVPTGGKGSGDFAWLSAVNILLVRLLREQIGKLPDEHAEVIETVLPQVLGGAFCFLAEAFVRQQLPENVRAAALRCLSAPVPALAFFRRQPRGLIFADMPEMTTAYGLDAELIPRMRQTFAEMPAADAVEVLHALSADATGEHLLRRSWLRLSLKGLAEQSGQARWMKWAQDARRLNQLLSAPAEAADALGDALAAAAGHPLADWLAGVVGGAGIAGGEVAPWREDAVTVLAFRLFEQDARIETMRREQETRWLDREQAMVGDGRGSEAGRLLLEAFRKGRLALLQADAEAPLFTGRGTRTLQGCLRVEWSDFLRVAAGVSGAGMNDFLHKTFRPGIAKLLAEKQDVFVDGLDASGLLLRGEASVLLFIGAMLAEEMRRWLAEAAEGDAQSVGKAAWGPNAFSMCLAAGGEWLVSGQKEGREADALKFGLAFSPAVAQAVSAVCRNEGLFRLLARQDREQGRKQIGAARIEALKMADGKDIPVLCNRGFVVTGSALRGIVADAAVRARRFAVEGGATAEKWRDYHWPGDKLRGVVLENSDAADDGQALALLFIGKVVLAGSVEDVFEVLAYEHPLVGDAFVEAAGSGG